MTTEQLFLIANGILIAICGYFLIKTMSKLDTTADKAVSNENSIALLDQKTSANITLLKQETGSKHERLEEKLDDLKGAIVSLTDEIKRLNNR